MTGKVRGLLTLWRNRTLATEQREALQLQKLRLIVRATMRDVPYYRALYREAGVHADQLRTMDDLQRLPMIAKPQLRAAGIDAVVSERLAPQCRVVLHTSGTSGVPLTIPLSPDDVRIRGLVDFRGLLTLGFRPWDRLVTVGPGFPRPPAMHERLGLFRTRVIPGTLPLEQQIAQLRDARPTILWCYPSELRALLHHPDGPLRGVRPRFLIVSGAVLHASVRRMAEEQLRCPIFVSYAAMECGRMAIQCPVQPGLHVNVDHVLLELVQGDRPAAPGETGEVVLTALNQFAMPFIRYRLGDLTSWTDEPCKCGSTFPMIRAPEGRIEEPLCFAGGVVLSPTRLFLALRASEIVEQYQVIQEARDWLRILIMPARAWRDGERELLSHQLFCDIPAGVRTDIEFVQQFEETGGKARVFISKLREL